MTVLKTWGQNGNRLLELTEKAVMVQRERTTAHQSQFRLLAKSDRLLPVPAVCSTPMCLRNHNESRVLCTRGAGATKRGERRRRRQEKAGTYVLSPSSQSRPFLCPATLQMAYPLMSLLDSKSLRLPGGPRNTVHTPHSAQRPLSHPALYPFSKSPLPCSPASVHSLLRMWLRLALLCPRADLPPSHGASSLRGRASAPSPWTGLNYDVWSGLLSFPC